MEKRDLVFLGIAVGVVLFAALVAKPALTGQGFPNLHAPFGSPMPTPTSTYITPTPSPVRMAEFATLSGNHSGSTETLEIPFSYWEIQFTAEPGGNRSDADIRIFPRLKIQIIDADNPARIVRNIEPDLLDARINSSYDPRPWNERIDEGNHRYYFVIDIQQIEWYQIDILVPQPG
jgi:hypothetical protein